METGDYLTSIKIKLLSKRIFLLLVGLFFMALFAGVSLYWIAFWFLLLWLMGSMLWLLYTAWSLNLTLQIRPALTVRNDRIDLNVILNRRSFLPFPPGELHLMHGPSWHHIPRYHLLYQNARVEGRVEVDKFSPSRGWKRSFQLDCFSRGHHDVGPLKISLFEPLGGIVVEKIFSLTKSFTVQPRLLPFHGFFPVKNGMPGEARRKNFIAPPDATESYDPRPFIYGDPPKRINWKVSARHGDLYTRRLEDRKDNRFLVCIELSRSLFASSLEQDLFLEESLSLIGYLLTKGFYVGVLTSDGVIKYLPPGNGKKQLFLTRKLFTELKPEVPGNLVKDLLRSTWNEKNLNLLWITPELDQKYMANLRKLQGRWQLHTLFITNETLDRELNGFLRANFPLQLECRNDKVGIGEVKIS